MAKLGVLNVAGRSGAVYKFLAYSLDTTFRRHRPAVLVLTRRQKAGRGGSFKHRRLAIDQTDDVWQLLVEHPNLAKAQAANCICLHAEADAVTRQTICDDLRKA